MDNTLAVESGTSPRLLGTVRLKVRAALWSAGILVLGGLTAPRAAPSTTPAALATPDERTAPLLQEELDRRDALRPFDRVQEIGSRVVGYSVAIPPRPPAVLPSTFDVERSTGPQPQPPGFGVVVSADGDILVNGAALQGRPVVQLQMLGGALVDAAVTSYDPGDDIALVHVEAPGTEFPAAPLAALRPAAGAIATAASRWNATDFITPVFVAAVGPRLLSISGGGNSLAPGTPLYNGDGELFGVTASRDQPGAAFFVPDAVARLRRRQADGRGHPSALGVAFQTIDRRLSSWFGERGAIVVQVIQGGAADIAGVKAGDVLIGLGDTPIDSPRAAQDALAATAAGTRAVARLIRSGTPLTLEVTLGSALEALTLRTHEPLQTPVGQVSARDVFSPADLSAAGISADAKVLRINDRLATTIAQAQRDLRLARGPVLLYVQQEGRRYFAAGEVSR